MPGNRQLAELSVSELDSDSISDDSDGLADPQDNSPSLDDPPLRSVH